MAAHVSTLLHAAVLLGLVWAARLSTLGPGWQDVAAWLVVVSSALIAAKDTVNWLTGVQDEFGERPGPRRWPRSPRRRRRLASVSSSSASSPHCDPRSHGRMGRPPGRIDTSVAASCRAGLDPPVDASHRHHKPPHQATLGGAASNR